MKISVSPNCRCRSRNRLRTCAWIETSSAEIGSSATISSGLSGNGARNAGALTLPAGELMREVARKGAAEPDQLENLDHAPGGLGRADAVRDQRLRDDVFDPCPRIEGTVRILKHRLDVPP